MTSATADELKQQGNRAFSAGDYSAAIDLFTQAIAVDESNHVLYSNRSAAYAGKKEYTSALQDADKVLELKPDWSKGYGRKGAALFGLGRLEEAEKTYAKGLELEPTSAPLKKGLEDVQAAQAPPAGMPNIFGSNIFETIAKHPKLCAYLADPTYMQAIQSIQKNPETLTQYMQDPRVMETLGAALGVDMKMATPEEAANMGHDASQDVEMPQAAPVPPPAQAQQEPEPQVAEPEVELTPEEQEAEEKKKQSQAEKELGNTSYKSKNFDAALQHYSKAWELNQDDITVLTNKAAVYMEMGDYDNCIKTSEEAVDRGREIRADFKHIARALGRIGSAYQKKEQLPEAIKFFQKSLSEHRTPDILNKLREAEKLKEAADRQSYQDPALADEARNKGNELFKAHNYAEAVPLYTEAIKRAESDPRAYSNRSACYLKLMAMPNALSDAEKAISLDPTFVKGYLRKAAAQFAMKEYLKCSETCDQGLAVDAQHHQGKNQAELQAQKQKATMAMYGYGGDTSDENMSQEERAKKAMQDPKVQEIMSDPVMRQLLEQMSQDPQAARE